MMPISCNACAINLRYFVWLLKFCITIAWDCVQNPAIADIYTEHSVQTTVAKYSPSGFYIASAGDSVKLCSVVYVVVIILIIPVT